MLNGCRIVLVAVALLAALPLAVLAQRDRAGVNAIDCTNLQSKADAFIVLDAADEAVTNLDGNNNGEPCEEESDINTKQPADCGLFLETDSGQAIAQALLEESENDYGLDPDGNGVACDTGAPGNPSPTEAPDPTRAPRPRRDRAPNPTPEPDPPPVVVDGRELPPEIAERVEGCSAVAVSRRSVAAAGCPPPEAVIVIVVPRGGPDLEPFARAGSADTRRGDR